MKRFSALMIIITIILALLVALPAQAAPLLQATETPTPTPVIPGDYVELEDGTLFLSNVVTLGDVATVAALLLIAMVIIPYVAFRVVIHYFR